MRTVLSVLFVLGLLLPAPTKTAEAQIIIPLPPPNASTQVIGDPCERCWLAAGCNCTLMPPIIVS